MFTITDLRLFSLLYKEQDSGCWEWQGIADLQNYGRHKGIQATWIAWIIANKQAIPPQQLVLQQCNNSLCVNPQHLYLGTLENVVEDRGDVLSIVEMENLQEDIKARRKWVVHRRQIANTLVDTHSVATPEELQLLEYINSKKQRRRSSYDVGRLVAEVNSDSLIVIKQAIRNKGMTLQAALLLGLIDFLELKLSLEDLTPSYKINSEGRSNDVRSHSLST